MEGFTFVCERDIGKHDITSVCSTLHSFFANRGLCDHFFHVSGDKIVFDKYSDKNKQYKAMRLPGMDLNNNVIFKEGENIITSSLVFGTAPPFTLRELTLFEWALNSRDIKTILFREGDE